MGGWPRSQFAVPWFGMAPNSWNRLPGPPAPPSPPRRSNSVCRPQNRLLCDPQHSPPGFFLFFTSGILIKLQFPRLLGGGVSYTLCLLPRIQRRGKRRKRDAPMPPPQNMGQENRDRLLAELRSPDRPEPDKRGLDWWYLMIVQHEQGASPTWVKKVKILQDLS